MDNGKEEAMTKVLKKLSYVVAMSTALGLTGLVTAHAASEHKHSHSHADEAQKKVHEGYFADD